MPDKLALDFFLLKLHSCVTLADFYNTLIIPFLLLFIILGLFHFGIDTNHQYFIHHGRVLRMAELSAEVSLLSHHNIKILTHVLRQGSELANPLCGWPEAAATAITCL